MHDLIETEAERSPSLRGGPAHIVATFSALAQLDLRPCLIRADAEPLAWTNEIDLLVHPLRLRATLIALRDLGWEIGNTGFFNPSRRHLLLWADNRLVRIDLYTKIVSAGLEYIDADDYLSGASLRGDVYVPDAAHWLLHIVVNTILEKKKLREEYRPRVAEALKDRDACLRAAARAEHLGIGFLFEDDSTLDFLFQENLIETLKPRVRSALLKARLANKVRLAWRWIVQTIGNKLALRPGFSIAIVGPDGAGKTTFINTLQTELNRVGIETSTLYFGPWERPLLRSSKALRNMGADPLDLGANSPARKTTLKLVKAYARRVLFYLNFLPEMWARFALRVWPAILERNVVLLDRHPIDLEVGYYNTPMQNSAGLRHLLVKLSPRPRMLILLDNDAEVVWNRKKEFTLELIKNSFRRYRALAPKYNMIVVKTDRPSELLVREFIERHWRDFVRLRIDGLPILRKM
jgi:thymidylate kinase